MSSTWVYLSIRPDSTIRKKPFGLARQHVERGAHLVGQVGLVGKFLHRAALEELAVEHAVHVAGVEQAEQLSGVRVGGRLVSSAAVVA